MAEHETQNTPAPMPAEQPPITRRLGVVLPLIAIGAVGGLVIWVRNRNKK